MADNDSDNDIFAKKNQRKDALSSRRNRNRDASFEAESLDPDLDNDLRLSRAGTINQIQTSKGKNQTNKSRAYDDDDEGNYNSNSYKNIQDNNNNRKPLTGWDDDDLGTMNTKTNSRRDIGSSEKNDYDQQAKANYRKVNQREIFDKNDEDMDIPEIPDLDEQNDVAEDMAFKVAEAPDVQVHQIASYKELDHEFFKEKAFQFLEGNIDVSLLHCGLNNEKDIVEDDVIWDWTKLFTEVVSVVQIANESNNTSTFDEEIEQLNERNRSNTKPIKRTENPFDIMNSNQLNSTTTATTVNRTTTTTTSSGINDADDILSSRTTSRNQNRYRKRDEEDIFKDFLDN